MEFLRKLYANAGFSIRPQARNGKVDLMSHHFDDSFRDRKREFGKRNHVHSGNSSLRFKTSGTWAPREKLRTGSLFLANE